MSDIYQFNVGGTTYNLANLGLLAPVQITLTADRLYNTGDQFIYTGLLYEATETIAQGTSITIGSNAQLADCVTKQISEINSNLTMGGLITLNNYVKYRIMNKNMMIVYPTYDQAISPWSKVNLGTLPSNITVLQDAYVYGGFQGSSHTSFRGQWIVYTNGNVALSCWEDSVSTAAVPFSSIIVPIQNN